MSISLSSVGPTTPPGTHLCCRSRAKREQCNSLSRIANESPGPDCLTCAIFARHQHVWRRNGDGRECVRRRRSRTIQGHLAHKKQPPPRTLQRVYHGLECVQRRPSNALVLDVAHRHRPSSQPLLSKTRTPYILT